MNASSGRSLVILGILLAACQAAAPAAAQQTALSLVDRERKILTYNESYIPSPDPETPWFGRSGFIHPVYTPSGRVVTEGFPGDHMHQHGLMFAWTSSRFDGHKVDFWNSAAKQGRIEHVETLMADNDAITVRLQHVDITTDTPTVVLNETWELSRVPNDNLNVFDLVSTQTCATDRALKIKEYHYGAMCIRGPMDWLQKRATMKTNEGQQRKQGNHSRPNWVSMHGYVDGALCGIVAMGHPSNFGFPQPVRLHPNKPYFCFAPMVLGDFEIKPDSPYVSRYRFIAFDGEPDENAITEIWKQYTEE